jgi:hypothetical protein
MLQHVVLESKLTDVPLDQKMQVTNDIQDVVQRGGETCPSSEKVDQGCGLGVVDQRLHQAVRFLKGGARPRRDAAGSFGGGARRQQRT